MPAYVILSALTNEGRKTIKKNPKRILQVNKELKKMGVKIKEQSGVPGPYDFANIMEAKDNETVMKMSLEIGARVFFEAHDHGVDSHLTLLRNQMRMR
jgi:uncharacterized protein with GYD domain